MLRAAIFDIDNTLLKGRSSERIFIKYLLKKGTITPLDILRFLCTFLFNLLTLQGLYLKNNKSYLKGKEPAIVREEARCCFREHIAPFITPKAREEIERKKAGGYTIILVSGTLDVLVEEFKEALGASAAVGSNLQRTDGLFTGRLEGIHPYGQGKASILQRLALQMDIDLKNSYAYADHYSDVEFLGMVGHPMAVNAHPVLRLYAHRKGWSVVEF
ncbi:MAG TPA: HAD family hydrolase [Candidatus Tripitaka californicus]|uniref:HAD family hydrolase n=1 Tax=Candidatus Tripitaka californicus TaxID=3367616 RepID=UPI004025FD87|nr:HAD-IB family hydrolase [Planctomycetota bacterium]